MLEYFLGVLHTVFKPFHTTSLCSLHTMYYFFKSSLCNFQDNLFEELLIKAVARSENSGGHVVLGGDNVPFLVDIGLNDLPKTGGGGPACDRPAYVVHYSFANNRSHFMRWFFYSHNKCVNDLKWHQKTRKQRDILFKLLSISFWKE